MISNDFTSIKILGISMRSEIDARNTYREKAAHLTNSKTKKQLPLPINKEYNQQTLLERANKQMHVDVLENVHSLYLQRKNGTLKIRVESNFLETLDFVFQNVVCHAAKICSEM